MSRAPKNTALRAEEIDIKRFEVQRIRLNKQGYDATGTYWGAGPDVCIATSPNGIDEVTVRAHTLTEARANVIDVLTRAPGEMPADREKFGGASAHTSRYEIEWRDPNTDANVKLRITHARNYLGTGQDHVEIESLKPKRAALPITDTGYKSHFITALDLINAGGPITFVTAWLDAEARGKGWHRLANVKAQGDLFQWAAAKTEVGKPKPGRHDGAPSRRSKPRRSPDGTDPH